MTDRRFRVEMSCPRPPTRGPIKADRHQDKVDRFLRGDLACFYYAGYGQQEGLRFEVTHRAAKVSWTVSDRDAAAVLTATEGCLRMFLELVYFQVPDGRGVAGPVRATLEELEGR